MADEQWEYRIDKLPISSKEEQIEWLDNFGSLGWEMTGISNTTTAIYIFFKRILGWK